MAWYAIAQILFWCSMLVRSVDWWYYYIMAFLLWLNWKLRNCFLNGQKRKKRKMHCWYFCMQCGLFRLSEFFKVWVTYLSKTHDERPSSPDPVVNLPFFIIIIFLWSSSFTRLVKMKRMMMMTMIMMIMVITWWTM